MIMQIRRYLFLFLCVGALQQSHAQVTAFSYNGRLSDNGQPGNGVYDMNFTLFDAQTGGNVMASVLAKSWLKAASPSTTASLRSPWILGPMSSLAHPVGWKLPSAARERRTSSR